MAITFNSIPTGIRTPGQYAEFSSERAVAGTPVVPHLALLLGQRLTGGSVAENVPTLIPSGDDADTYWGRGSYIANMARAFKALNTQTELWGIGIDDAAGTQGTQTLTFGGTATEDGTVVIYVGGRRVAVAVSSGDANTVVSVAANTALGLHTDLSMTFGEAAGVVTATARQDGTLGNEIDIRHSYQAGESLPDGITLAIATGVTGATDPALTNAIAAMGDVQYRTIACALADDTNLDLLETELDDRWGPLEQKDGHCFVGFVGTQGNATSYGNARNSKHTTAMACGESPGPAWLWAALCAAVDSAETDPARPRQALALTPALNRAFAPAPADRFTQAERAILLTDGMATHTVDASGVVRIERLITTYQTNALSVLDPSYLDICTMRTLDYLRYSQNARIALRFPRHKLADDGTRFGPGQAVVTPSIIRAELLQLFTEWETDGLVEGWEQFTDDLLVERNATDTNRVDVRMSPDLMNQFRVFAGQIQFIL